MAAEQRGPTTFYKLGLFEKTLEGHELTSHPQFFLARSQNSYQLI